MPSMRSTIPMLDFARRMDAAARSVREKYENDVKAVVTKNSTLIAKAKFALEGTSTYPDATFTLRLSYGTVKGYPQDGKEIAPITDFAGAYAHETGRDPFKLPASWEKAKADVDGTANLDIATTNDIIGGNSGSPVIGKDGDATGLIFDGNIQSLGGDFGYDGTVNRAVGGRYNSADGGAVEDLSCGPAGEGACPIIWGRCPKHRWPSNFPCGETFEGVGVTLADASAPRCAGFGLVPCPAQVSARLTSTAMIVPGQVPVTASVSGGAEATPESIERRSRSVRS